MADKRLNIGRWVIALAVAVATLAVYWEVRQHSFVNYDDDRYITNNIPVHAGLTWRSIGWAFRTPFFANWIPLTWLSHMLDFQLFGMNAGGHHMSSLLIHIANTVVLFFMLERLTGALWRSGLVAALFAMHPLNVESVAWVAERKNVLCTLFFFLAIWAYGWYVRKGGWRRYAVVMVVFAMGLMSKSMVISLPFVLLLLDYWPLGRFAIGPDKVATTGESDDVPGEAVRTLRRVPVMRLVLEKVPLLLIAVADGVVTFWVQLNGKAVGTLEGFPLGVRIENAIVSYVVYLEKTFWPAKLAVFYPHPKTYLPGWKVGVAGIVLVTISIGVIWGARRIKYLGVGWMWFLGTLVPVIGLVQIGGQSMADRYAYIPLVGIFVLVVWGAADLAERYRPARDYIIVSGVCAIFALIIVTRVQLGYWADSNSLWYHAQEVTEDNYVAYNHLGGAFLKQGRIDQAAPFLFKALEINPDLATAQQDVGILLVQTGHIDEGIEHFNRAIELDPEAFGAYNELGVALSRRGQLDESIRCLDMSLSINPDYVLAMYNLAAVLARQGKLDQASVCFEKALQLAIDPELATHCHLLYGNLLVQKGEPVRASEQYRAALSLEPDFSPAADALSKIKDPGH